MHDGGISYLLHLKGTTEIISFGYDGYARFWDTRECKLRALHTIHLPSVVYSAEIINDLLILSTEMGIYAVQKNNLVRNP